MSTSQQPLSAVRGLDRDALLRVVEPIVRAHGAELCDVEFKPDRGSWVLRIFVEKAGSTERKLSTRDAAVDLELCANISRDLSPALDVADLVEHRYSLEVGSPGVERALRDERDFVRFSGEKAKIRLREPLQGQRVVVGSIEASGDGGIRITEGKRTVDLRLSQIESARLVFELPTHAKGGVRGARPPLGHAPQAPHPKAKAAASQIPEGSLEGEPKHRKH